MPHSSLNILIHLNPEKKLEPTDSDIDAILATCESEAQFDKSLEESFRTPISELPFLNYPGVNNPSIKVQTKIQTKSALNHAAAVQYCLNSNISDPDNFLPESYNGLGYQNLIFMVFKLMRIRDGWMRVNLELQRDMDALSHMKEPIHLVFVEEPEAHLHAQVQQVFIRTAYDILRNHGDLQDKPQLVTQLIVSTHSSHIAHECEFSDLRYFQRVQHDSTVTDSIPESRVVSLATVFSDTESKKAKKSNNSPTQAASSEASVESKQNEEKERKIATKRFVTRYLQTTHCDLFFADAAIFIEGAGERILLPHFLKSFKNGDLFRCYISFLEIGGSHAFRLRELIECLGLTTLIITDIDSCTLSDTPTKKQPNKKSWVAQPIDLTKCQKTSNSTLKQWIPVKENINDLLDLTPEQKEMQLAPPCCGVRVAYQTPVTFSFNEQPAKVYTRTFEDSFLFTNYSKINIPLCNRLGLEGYPQLSLVKEVLEDAEGLEEVQKGISDLIASKKFVKAEFALEVLLRFDPQDLIIPAYIAEGLEWLYGKLVACNSAVALVNDTDS